MILSQWLSSCLQIVPWLPWVTYRNLMGNVVQIPYAVGHLYPFPWWWWSICGGPSLSFFNMIKITTIVRWARPSLVSLPSSFAIMSLSSGSCPLSPLFRWKPDLVISEAFKLFQRYLRNAEPPWFCSCKTFDLFISRSLSGFYCPSLPGGCWAREGRSRQGLWWPGTLQDSGTQVLSETSDFQITIVVPDDHVL